MLLEFQQELRELQLLRPCGGGGSCTCSSAGSCRVLAFLEQRKSCGSARTGFNDLLSVFRALQALNRPRVLLKLRIARACAAPTMSRRLRRARGGGAPSALRDCACPVPAPRGARPLPPLAVARHTHGYARRRHRAALRLPSLARPLPVLLGARSRARRVAGDAQTQPPAAAGPCAAADESAPTLPATLPENARWGVMLSFSAVAAVWQPSNSVRKLVSSFSS